MDIKTKLANLAITIRNLKKRREQLKAKKLLTRKELLELNDIENKLYELGVKSQ